MCVLFKQQRFSLFNEACCLLAFSPCSFNYLSSLLYSARECVLCWFEMLFCLRLTPLPEQTKQTENLNVG